MKKKIIIAGAGPAGCYLGQLLKKENCQVELLEEHAQIGKPVACAGIIGKGTFENSQISLPKNSILNVLHGAEIFYKDISFKLKRENAAYVVDRELFDQGLSRGLAVHLNTRLLDFRADNGRYVLETNQGQYTCDVLIGADGPHSLVRKTSGLNGSKIQYCWGAQYRLKLQKDFGPGDMVSVYFNRPFSSFSWIVPEGRGVIRIGSISDKPMDELKKLLVERNLKGKILDKVGGIIPIGYIKTAKENLALLGDAACQVKPLSGGGIYFGLKAAEVLAEAISKNRLKSYEKGWKRVFGREIQVALKARAIFDKLSQKTSISIFEFLKENVEKIQKTADFENHSSIILEFARNPRSYQIVGNVLFDFLKAI